MEIPMAKKESRPIRFKKIGSINKKVIREECSKYEYQPELTTELDQINGDFNLNILYKITLWKVNRYPIINADVISDFNTLRNVKNLKEAEKEINVKIILKLLACPGVRMPMASTYLRFLNPKVFQIIDRHAYRALRGEVRPYLKDEDKGEKTLRNYFKYLKDLRKVCEKKEIPFEKADRFLYVFDKKQNSKLNLDGSIKKSKKKSSQ